MAHTDLVEVATSNERITTESWSDAIPVSSGGLFRVRGFRSEPKLRRLIMWQVTAASGKLAEDLCWLALAENGAESTAAGCFFHDLF